MRKTNRKLLALVMSLLAVLMLFACGNEESAQPMGNEESEKENEAGVKVRDDLVIVMESEAPTLHPYDHTAVTSGYMNSLTYNALFVTDPVTLEPVPDLCESYEQADELTWIFKIYENVAFHDGSHMTAADVVASMEYAREYATTKQYSSFWQSAEQVGEYSIKVVTKEPYALTLLDMASLKVVPKALIESGNDFNLNPIGSGPYRFVSQVLGEKVEFESFDGYFNAEHRAKIRSLTWKIIPEGSSRTIALEAREADFIIEVETNDLERLSGSEGIEVQSVGGTRMNYFTLNNERTPFDNKDFRKGINSAIDREAVLAVALNGEGKVATAMCPTVFPGTSEECVEGYDPQKAQQYFDASGIDPKTIKFSCIVSNDAARRAAEVVQAYLQEFGIEMSIESLDYAAWLADVMGGNCDSAITGYTSSNLARYLSGTFHTSAIDAANQARVRDSYMDEKIDMALGVTDPDKANEVYRDVTAYINELTPYVPLYESVVTRAYNSALEGVVVGASGTVHFEDVYWIN